jgi:hypothetical protein
MLLKMVSRLLAQHVPVLTLTGNQRPGASVPPLAPMYSPLPPTIDLKTSVNAFMDHVLDVLDEMGIRYVYLFFSIFPFQCLLADFVLSPSLSVHIEVQSSLSY